MSRKKILFFAFSLVYLTGLVFGYFAFSPRELEKRCLFFPFHLDSYNDVPKKIFNASSQEVMFKSASGAILHGLYFHNPESKYTFLLHYGECGNLVQNIGLTKLVLNAGYSVLTYDYDGYGMSEGYPSCRRLKLSGLAANDYLVKRLGVKPEYIIQYGVSLGTGVASTVANERKCAGVFLISPYTSLEDASKDVLPHLNLYPKSMFPETELGSKQFVVANKSVPVFMWHGKLDRLIPVSHAKKLAKLSNGKATLLIGEKLHHGDFAVNEMSERVREFVESISRDRLVQQEKVEVTAKMQD